MSGIPRRTFLGETALAAGAFVLQSALSTNAAAVEDLYQPNKDSQNHHDPTLDLPNDPLARVLTPFRAVPRCLFHQSRAVSSVFSSLWGAHN